MVITDKFVYVHQPKTGGTFVTDVLLRLHGFRWSRYKHVQLAAIAVRARLTGNEFWRLEGGTRHGRIAVTEKHGTCREIPPQDRGKAIVATVRNPFDLYVSQYEFGWWKRREFRTSYRRDVPDFERRFPSFPDLSFAEFLDLMDAAFCRARDERGAPRVGWATEEFLRFYARRPDDALVGLADADGESPANGELFDVRFLRQERLNDDLYDFLVDVGYPARDVEFVKTSGRLLPKGRGRSSDQQWESYYTPELRERIRQRDRVLFRVFPDFDV